MQEKLPGNGCPDVKCSLAVVFRNHARCNVCHVKRRTIFSGRDTHELDVADARQMVYMGKNSIVLKSGDVLPFLYCIRDGWCRVEVNDGREKSTTLWYAGPGDMLGLSAVCSGEKNAFTVTAIDNVVLCRIPAPVFQRVLSSVDGLSL